jgi:GntR family transcriptional repressor for pyruvate dehydrogenase complex
VVDELFHSFNRQRLYDQIASYVEDAISAGRLEPGEQLPPERELAERFGVARGVIREATKLLAERGLVVVLPGRGTYIAEIDPDVLSGQISRLLRVGSASYHDLNEVRAILEVGIVDLAAERATPEDLVEMKQALDEMEVSLADPDRYIEADLDFHFALANAAKNPLFSQLVSAMVDALRGSRQTIFRVPGAPGRGQSWHRLIYEAVARGDSEAACDRMRKLMQQVMEDARLGEHAQATPTGVEAVEDVRALSR